MIDAPTPLWDAAKLIGAKAQPVPERFLNLGLAPMDSDLASRARLRRDEVRAAFLEGIAIGSQGFMDEREAGRAWRYSDTLTRLVSSMPGLKLVGERVVCSDPRAQGRDVWLIAGEHKARAWIVAGGVDLVVNLGTLRHLVSARPFTSSEAA